MLSERIALVRYIDTVIEPSCIYEEDDGSESDSDGKIPALLKNRDDEAYLQGSTVHRVQGANVLYTAPAKAGQHSDELTCAMKSCAAAMMTRLITAGKPHIPIAHEIQNSRIYIRNSCFVSQVDLVARSVSAHPQSAEDGNAVHAIFFSLREYSSTSGSGS